MDLNSKFWKQFNLIVQVLPYVPAENRFALKGGTAINLFFRNLQRVSVDIDLVYLPRSSWNSAIPDIHSGLETITDNASRKLFGAKVLPQEDSLHPNEFWSRKYWHTN